MRWKKTGCALLLAALTTTLCADRIKTTAIACPDMAAFKRIKALKESTENKELFIMQQGCVVLSPKDKIHVIDPENPVHGMFLRIQIDRTNETMYIRKNYVKVEQSGRGNVFRF